MCRGGKNQQELSREYRAKVSLDGAAVCDEGSGEGAFSPRTEPFFPVLFSQNVHENPGGSSRCTVWRCAIQNERCRLTVTVSGAFSGQVKYSLHGTAHAVVRVVALKSEHCTNRQVPDPPKSKCAHVCACV